MVPIMSPVVACGRLGALPCEVTPHRWAPQSACVPIRISRPSVTVYFVWFVHSFYDMLHLLRPRADVCSLRMIDKSHSSLK